MIWARLSSALRRASTERLLLLCLAEGILSAVRRHPGMALEGGVAGMAGAWYVARVSEEGGRYLTPAEARKLGQHLAEGYLVGRPDRHEHFLEALSRS